MFEYEVSDTTGGRTARSLLLASRPPGIEVSRGWVRTPASPLPWLHGGNAMRNAFKRLATRLATRLSGTKAGRGITRPVPPVPEIDRIGGSLRDLPDEAVRGRKRELRRPIAVRETFDLDAISKGKLSPEVVGAILKSRDSLDRRKVMLAAATGGYSATEEVARQALSSPSIEDRVVAVAALGKLGLAVDHSYLVRLAESVHLSQAAFLAASIRRFPPEVATAVGMTILERLEAESRSRRLGNESYDVHQAFTNAELAIREAQWLDPCPHLGLRQVAEVLRRWNECLSGPRPTAAVTRLRSGRETVVRVEYGSGRIRLGLSASPYLDDRGRLQVADALVCLWIGGVVASRIRMSCGTCPFLLYSMDDERLRKISATFSASSPSQLIGGSDLDEILKELRSGTYTLLPLRLRLKRVDPKEPRLWFLLGFGITRRALLGDSAPGWNGWSCDHGLSDTEA